MTSSRLALDMVLNILPVLIVVGAFAVIAALALWMQVRKDSGSGDDKD